MNNPILTKIRAYEQEIMSNKNPSDLKCCPQCTGVPQEFHYHDTRERIFLIIIDFFVHRIHSFLCRFKCPLCKKTFTYYPDYALPYKRYVQCQIEQKATEYLENDHKTYQDVASCDDSAIIHESSADDKACERHFAGSTVWRWISLIGSLAKKLPKMMDLIRKMSRVPEMSKGMPPIYFRKYRSEKRRQVLVDAAKVILVSATIRTGAIFRSSPS